MGTSDTYSRYARRSMRPTGPSLEERCLGVGPADVQDEIDFRQRWKEARAAALSSSFLAPLPSTSHIQDAAAAGADDDSLRWMPQMSTARGWHGVRTQSGGCQGGLEPGPEPGLGLELVERETDPDADNS